ncbi:hypothetical protein C8T65DRAFT_574463 [Cerioporus squamosus]|nr:hypothetical protein C8T65DRAFT_574463 [Cerioporus squamosus]
MKFSAVALTVAAAAAAVRAQSDSASSAAPTSTAGISPCILTCLTQAASTNGCQGITDLTCLCTNTQFQSDARSCLESSCSADEVSTAEALQSQECGAGDSATSAGTSAASSGASTSNAAGALKASFGAGAGGLAGVGFALAGVVAGAAMVL